MKTNTTNTHIDRDAWLRAATNELRPYFAKLGYTLPEKIRFAIAFPSTGKRGRMPGECWHADASDEQHYNIIIRADNADPVTILSTLVHELVHTLLPISVKHGKEFRTIAHRIGLEGPMRHTVPAPLLLERLQIIAASIGALPHGKLNFSNNVEAPKKQRTRHLKAECGATGCGYLIQLSTKWAKAGLPICPINAKHGRLLCDLPDDLDDDENTDDDGSKDDDENNKVERQS
jgi:hypothetical protein